MTKGFIYAALISLPITAVWYTLIALLRAIIAIIDGKPSGDVSERELIRALRDMGVVFE